MKQVIFHLLRPRTTIIKRTFYEAKNAGFPLVYDKPPVKVSIFEAMRGAVGSFKDECKLFIEEQRNRFNQAPVGTEIYEDSPIWKFDGTQKSLDQWVVNSDKDYIHGFSKAKLELSAKGTGIFHGVLDTRLPKDGRTIQSGYCNITTVDKLKSFRRKDMYDWTYYNELVLRVRGDGRNYLLLVSQKGVYDFQWYSTFSYAMFTRGGPYWQTVRVPFSKLVYCTKGFIHENQFSMPTDRVTNFGITLSDGKCGPFKLEIDFVGVRNNPSLFEEFAYEMYEIPRRYML